MKTNEIFRKTLKFVWLKLGLGMAITVVSLILLGIIAGIAALRGRWDNGSGHSRILAVQFRFNAVAHQGKGFVDLAVQLFSRQSVGQFDLDSGMVALAGEFTISRNFFAVRSIEFQHDISLPCLI